MKNTLEPASAQNLPALIERARTTLLEAKTSAEVLAARQAAELALHYARITKATNEMVADCLRIKILAQNRLVDEIDAAKERGELRTHGGARNFKIRGSDLETCSLNDIGIDVRRLYEWRKIRDLGEEERERRIAAALDEGRAPTQNDILKGATYYRSTGTDEVEWFTPALYIEAARAVLGEIDLDPASHPVAQCTVRATKFFTIEDDGLVHPWHGRVWLNPPYARGSIEKFIKKLIGEFTEQRVFEAILLTHNSTDTSWFHEAERCAARICFTRGRIAFVHANGNECSPPQGQAFFYYGANTEKFGSVFSKFGFIR